MISKVFWTIRFAIVVLGTAACFISIGVVLRLKLNNRLPMLYAVFIAICQSIICLTALIFGIGSAILVQNDSFNPEDYPAIMILCQLQAALFHSSELVIISLTFRFHIVWRLCFRKSYTMHSKAKTSMPMSLKRELPAFRYQLFWLLLWLHWDLMDFALLTCSKFTHKTPNAHTSTAHASTHNTASLST